MAADERTAVNSYQTSLHIEPNGHDVITEAMSQAASWLRKKKQWDARLDQNQFQTDKVNGRDLLTLHHDSKSGREFRMRLTEHAPNGIWRSQLTVSVPRDGKPYFALQVSNSEGRWAAVPVLATNLLDALSTKDGQSYVSSAPLIVSPSNADEFLDGLHDPDRRGLYLVAGTSRNDIDFRAFVAQVGRWTSQVRGLAQVAVLSPDATAEVTEALGRRHAIAPWTIRTFQPGIDTSDPDDSYRHKWITTERLARDKDAVIQQLLGRIARRNTYLRPAFDEYAAVDRTLRRLEDQTLVNFVATVPTVEEAANPPGDAPKPKRFRKAKPPIATPATADQTPEVGRLTGLIDLVKATLGIPEITAAALALVKSKASQADTIAENLSTFADQLAERDAYAAELEAEIATLRRAVDDTQLDIRIAVDDLSQFQDENRWLRQRLAATNDTEGAYGAVPDAARNRYPENFDELLQRIGEFQSAGVIFTGNDSETIAMDEHDQVGRAAQNAWEALLALADYIRAREEGACETGLHGYLRETPAGYRSMPAKKFAAKESGATMERWGEERGFRVPIEVSESGWAVMEAHFKLALIGSVSPRMYVLDCTGTTGKVYVGYIGAHLTNTKTN